MDTSRRPRNYSYYDDLLSSSLETSTAEFDVDSDVVLLSDTEGNSIRIGPLLNLFRSKLLGDESFWITTDLATAIALQDFNFRSNPFGTEFSQDCNLYLTMTMGPQLASGKLLINVVTDYQAAVLFAGNGTRPLAVLGGVSSTQSFLLGTLGAVTTKNEYKVEPFALSPDVRVCRQGVPNISPFSTALDLDELGYAPMFSRTIPSNVEDVRALCLYLNHLGVKRLGIFYANSVYGSNYFAALKRKADEYGMELKGFAYSPFFDRFQFEDILSQVKLSGITYMVGTLHPPAWRVAIRALLDAQLLNNPDYAWFFSDSLSPAVGSYLTDSEDISAQSLAKALNRTAIVRMAVDSNNYELHRQQLTNYTLDSDFVEYYQSLAGVNLSQTFLQPSVFSMLAYDAVLSLGLASCQTNRTFFWGPELVETISELNFQGATGRVSFNEANTRVASGLTYEIANIFMEELNASVYQSRSDSCILASSSDNLTVLCNLTFPSGSTTAPASVPPVQENLNLVPLGVQVFVWVLSAVVILLTLYCAFWTIQHRQRPIVRASQPLFLVILCVGTLLIALDMIFLTLQDPVTGAACMASAWFLSIGFTTIFSALFAKTWRIARVYSNARKFRRVTITARDVMWPIVVLLTLDIIILTVWTVVAPLEWVRYTLTEDSYDRTTSSRGTCLPLDGADTTDWIFLVLVLVINLFTLIISNYMSYKARKLPSDFNESKHIFMSNVILLEDFIIGIPVVMVVRNSSSTSVVLVRALLNAIICFGVLLPMFVPKFTKERDDKARRYVPSGTPSSENMTPGVKSRFDSSGYVSKATGKSHVSGLSGVSSTNESRETKSRLPISTSSTCSAVMATSSDAEPSETAEASAPVAN